MRTTVPEHVTVTCDCCGRECGPDRMISVAQGDAAGTALKPLRCRRADLGFRNLSSKEQIVQDFCDDCLTRILLAINRVSLETREELGQPMPEYWFCQRSSVGRALGASAPLLSQVRVLPLAQFF